MLLPIKRVDALYLVESILGAYAVNASLRLVTVLIDVDIIDHKQVLA